MHITKAIKATPLPVWITTSIAICIAVPALFIFHLKPQVTVPPKVIAVAFSADSECVAAGLHDGTVQIWQTQSWQPVHRFHVKDGGLNTLTFSPDSKLLAVAGRLLSLWVAGPWHEWKTLGTDDVVYGTARFDHSGLHLASVNSSEQIDLWNTQTGAKIRSLCCMALYGDVAFSPDGRRLAAAGHWPRIWDLSNGREVYRLVQTRNPTFACIQFSSDGQLLATGSQDGITRIWRASTGRLLFASQPREGYIETVAFQPGGDLIAYGVPDGSLLLWDPRTQREQRIARTSSNVAFSADGRLLVFGTPGSVHVWDVNAARELACLRIPPYR